MIFSNSLVLWFISLVHFIVAVNVVTIDDSGAKDFLRSLNEESAELASKLISAQWEFEINNTDIARKELFQITSEAIKSAKLRFQNVLNNYPWKSFSNSDIQRQLKLFSEIGTLALPDEEYNELQKIFSDLEVIQQKTTICDFYNKTKCDLHLHPDIKEKLETSQNTGELSYLWTEWKKATEPEFKRLLDKYVKLCNEAATLNNYVDFREYSLRNNEADDIENMKTFWEDIKPLYSQIHAYVRKKLRDVYGEKIVPSKGLIPAHLLGNIWSENWSGIGHRVVPFPEHDNFNFTSAMYKQGFTHDLIHKSVENFFASMNFSIPENLWVNVSETPLQNSEECHPKIFNLYPNGFRIKDCRKISLKNYLEDIRLLTKAEYMLQYSNQPFIYQTPAAQGLEEAVENVMTMSASTFNNLKNLGLYQGEITEEIRLNKLFKMALEKITSIPFLLVQEFWRWDIYSGKNLEESMTTVNDLREKFQGISTFTKELTFDPGGIGSAFSKTSLVQHFLSYFLEFQLYEFLCQKSDASNQKNDLSECNLSHNMEAGKTLRNLMSLGSSKPFSETLLSALGVNKVNSKYIVKYFEPLMKWLTTENEKTGEFIGWEKSEGASKKVNSKSRRKRSLEDYPSEVKDDDSDFTPSREPDRFQRLIYKRSKNNLGNSEMNERQRKSAENIENNEKKSKSTSSSDQKLRRNIEEEVGRLFYTKNRRSLTKNNKELKDSYEDSVAESEKGRENGQKMNKYTSRNVKRYSNFDQTYDRSKSYTKSLSSKREDAYQKRSDFGIEKNYENPTNENEMKNNVKVGSGNNNKKRFARRPRAQNQIDSGATSGQSHQIWRRKENYPSQRDRASRNAQWHSDTKKDISRLLHSFGFAAENDDKDKIKELKKKLKGDSSSDMNSNIASKESSYESLMDYNRVKSSDGRSDAGEDKGTNKLWSVKSYLTDSSKIVQANPSLEKKESLSGAHISSSLMGHSTEEKSIGKKETSQNNEVSLASAKERLAEGSESHLVQNSDSGMRRLNIGMPSLQALLQKSDMSGYGQRQMYSITPDMSDSKVKIEMNPMYRTKSNVNKYANSYLYKYIPTAPIDSSQYKDRKGFREDSDNGSKSPYIIILGEIAPDMREKLMQDKGVSFLEVDKQLQLQSGSNMEEKKMSDKRSRASEQIYIVPIDLKNSQHNLMKPNHYADHEHEAGHDPNTERDQESEEEQLHLEDNSKLGDKSNFYKTGKENPSEFIISWNNDKNRKIVKRSKREHKKEIGDEKLKVVRIAPMKESFLEGLLGKSLDHASLDDKNVKILIHDGLLNGNSDFSSALTGSQSPMPSSPVGINIPDQSQTSSLQGSSSLSSLASSVLSALSPKSYSQAAKANSQHLESDLEEENLKEGSNNQALGEKKGAKLYSDEDTKKLLDADPAAKGDDACCKKIILTPCPPKPCPGCPCPCPGSCPCPCPLPCPLPCPCPCPCPSPCPCPCPSPCPCPCPCPDDCCKRVLVCPPVCCKPECDLCCKKPSECSLVNCQFKITKAKKPHERLTIMIYDRINPPAELPEPYDALAVISEILQRIQCCSCKPCCQLTEEDPDYPANDNSDQLKGNSNSAPDNKGKIQEVSGEIPILGGDSPEEDETDDTPQSSPNSPEEDKFQPKEKATPAIDQLTVFNKDKLKPVFIELRKIDDIIKKRSQKE